MIISNQNNLEVFPLGENNSNVMSLFSRMDEERKAKQKRSKGQEKRLTVVLSDYDFRRLKFIANHFEELPSVFARNLLLESLKDAEDFLDLDEVEEGTMSWIGDEPVFDYSEYGKYINGVLDTLDGASEEEDDGVEEQTPKRKRVAYKKTSNTDE